MCNACLLCTAGCCLTASLLALFLSADALQTLNKGSTACRTYEVMHAYRPQSSVFGIADHACQQCLSALQSTLLPRVFAAGVQVH